MKEITEQEKYFKTKRWLIIGIAALFIIVCLLLVDRCNKGKEISDAKTSYAQIEGALKNVLSQDKHVRKYADSIEKRNSDLELEKAESRDNVEFYQKLFTDENYKAYRLSIELKKAKAANDTARYIEACDSLGEANIMLKGLMDTLIRVNNRNEEINSERLRGEIALSQHWKRGYDSCMSAVKTADNLLPDIKPKSKFYIDGKVLFGAVTGVGGGFSLVDTKGNKFSVTASATTSGPLYEAGYGRLISLKRRR
jgi:hypothetical protein